MLHYFGEIVLFGRRVAKLPTGFSYTEVVSNACLVDLQKQVESDTLKVIISSSHSNI